MKGWFTIKRLMITGKDDNHIFQVLSLVKTKAKQMKGWFHNQKVDYITGICVSHIFQVVSLVVKRMEL